MVCLNPGLGVLSIRANQHPQRISSREDLEEQKEREVLRFFRQSEEEPLFRFSATTFLSKETKGPRLTRVCPGSIRGPGFPSFHGKGGRGDRSWMLTVFIYSHGLFCLWLCLSSALSSFSEPMSFCIVFVRSTTVSEVRQQAGIFGGGKAPRREGVQSLFQAPNRPLGLSRAITIMLTGGARNSFKTIALRTIGQNGILQASEWSFSPIYWSF